MAASTAAPMHAANANGAPTAAPRRHGLRTRRPSCRLLAEHHAPDFVDGRFRAAELADEAAAVERDDAVREREHFVELLRDQQNRAAAIAERGDLRSG